MSLMTKVAAMPQAEFARLWAGLHQEILRDPMANFVEAEAFLNFKPTLAQRVVLKSVFRQPLDASVSGEVRMEAPGLQGSIEFEKKIFNEVTLFEAMTGIPYDDERIQVSNINLIIGRRGGKSTLSAIISLYSAIKMNWKPFVRKTPVATVAVLSHSVEFSEEVLDIFRNFVEDSPILNRLVMSSKDRKNTRRTFHLGVPFLVTKRGKEEIQLSEVAIKVGAASKKTTRGRAVCAAITDEIAHWNLQENSAESDDKVLTALRPAMGQFGRHAMLIKSSSPAIKQGVLYSEWIRRQELRDTTLQFKAPSWIWNDWVSDDFYQQELLLDSFSFDSEYRSNFVESMESFIPPEHVDACVLRGYDSIPPINDGKSVYSAAIDAAFKSDRFAFSLVAHRENRIVQHVCHYWEGTRSKPVSAHEVAAFIRETCRKFGISQVIADQHGYQPLREIFQNYGISLIENTFTLPYKKKIYFALRQVIKDQTIDLLDIPLLHQELKQLQCEKLPSGQVRIGHPRGGNDDLSDALAISVYHALEKGVGFLASFESDGKPLNSAPSFEALRSYKGFEEIVDNSGDYEYDKERGEWRRRESQINEQDGFSFSFS